MPWDLMRDVVDVGITPDYEAYFRAHTFPHITTLGDPVPRMDDEDDDEDGGPR